MKILHCLNKSSKPIRKLLTQSMSVYGTGQDEIELAVRLLKDGNVIGLPTDTIYGLAAIAQDTVAIRKLYEIKGRDSRKPLAICVGKVEDVGSWGHIELLPINLLNSLLPGPVTIVLNRTLQLNPNLNPNTSKVGIRIPDNSFIQKVTKCVGLPLALTSANRSNEPSCVLPIEFKSLWPHLGAVFDGGLVGELRAGSTVVDLSVPGMYHILRPGSALANTKAILTKFNLVDIDSN